jgi:hypothetical protein
MVIASLLLDTALALGSFNVGSALAPVDADLARDDAAEKAAASAAARTAVWNHKLLLS